MATKGVDMYIYLLVKQTRVYDNAPIDAKFYADLECHSFQSGYFDESKLTVVRYKGRDTNKAIAQASRQFAFEGCGYLDVIVISKSEAEEILLEVGG